MVSVSLYMHWYFLIFSFWTVKRSLCTLAVMTGGSICLWCLYLYICTGISLYFLIEQWRDHSVLWQWWQGGPSAFSIYMFSLCTGISLYFLISWLFRMGSHWLHCKAKSLLWALAVSNGGYILRFTWCHTDISLYLTVSNGCSLTALKSEDFTLSSGSFKWQGHQFYLGKSENLSSQMFRCAHQ